MEWPCRGPTSRKILYSYPNRTLMRQKYVRHYESGRENAIHWNESGMKEVVELITAMTSGMDCHLLEDRNLVSCYKIISTLN